MKRCSKCKKEKDPSLFNKRAASSDGLRASCKDCDQATRESWQKKQVTSPNLSSLGSGGGGDGGEGPVPAPDVSKVIGKIEPGEIRPPVPRIVDGGYEDPSDAEERRIQDEYASLLNQKLPIRKRAALMVKIARNAEGANAALALRALQDINLATKVTSRTGAQVDLGPMFVVQGGDEIKVK